MRTSLCQDWMPAVYPATIGKGGVAVEVENKGGIDVALVLTILTSPE